ncbi:peptidase domain-containing ABC transporter [Ruegeria atlantica]|uniref:peptidase domain-containing ABC transporter n=1 Tax=Ruegeria atlantica TaxID=81569 RepID=UPI001479D80B|nr:peptidase domain-containing ABC transporter [Ruegeria atlantica]
MKDLENFAMTQTSSGLECLVLVARFLGTELSRDAIIRQHSPVSSKDCTARDIQLAAEANYLDAEISSVSWSALRRMGRTMPFIIHLKNGEYVILSGLVSDPQSTKGGLIALVQDPLADSLELLRIPEKEFRKRWDGTVILLRLGTDDKTPYAPFDLRWIFSEAGKFKGIFVEIGLISVFIHLVGFITAIFTMIVFDKVIGYEGYSTLHTLFMFAVAAIGIAGLLGYLRTLMLVNVTVKLDILMAKLSSKRLLDLPVSFFEGSATGTLAKKLQEASAIREFVTGRLLATLIELSAVVLILPVLFLLSSSLTVLVLAFSAVMMIQVVLALRPHRKHLTALYQTESERQAMIVETVMGIGTIKSLALEEEQRQKWMQKTSEAVLRQKSVSTLNGFLQETSGFLQKLMQLTIIWLGAQFVLAGEMTIGTLIAFNILSGRIAGPLVQLVGLTSKYQETAISVKMLGSVLNRAPERLHKGGVTPPINGEITMENVEYSYDEGLPPVLKNVSFRIPPGSVVGIVGQSGSGKSTLAKLLQGFDLPQSGYVRIDGFNIREYDLQYLRRSLATVSQDNFLFKGTIAENIAAGHRHAERTEIIEVAQKAQAHEFIRTLPDRYDTVLEEHASNLSGGQKQRICIARALLRPSKLMLLDEAMSAIDAHMEEQILSQILENRGHQTIVNISHRMPTMLMMDYVLVMHEGEVADFATHDVLMQRCEPYRTLWASAHRFQSPRNTLSTS